MKRHASFDRGRADARWRGCRGLRYGRAAALALTLTLPGCSEQEPAARPAADGGAAVAPDESPEQDPSNGSGQRPPPLEGALAEITSLIGRGEFEQARMRTEEYIDRHPDDGRAVFLLGLSYHKERAYGKARPHFERALQLSPEYGVIHHFYGYCLYNLGDLDGARAAFTNHLRFDPSEADSYFGLGLVELDSGKLDEAEAAFRRSIELTESLQATDPPRFLARRGDLAKGHARLGDVYFARSDYEHARDELIAAIQIYPLHYAPYYTLSLVYRRLEQDDLADEALRRYQAVKQQVRPEPTTPP